MKIKVFLLWICLSPFSLFCQEPFAGDTVEKNMYVTSMLNKKSFFLITAKDSLCDNYTIVSEKKRYKNHTEKITIKPGKSYQFVVVPYSSQNIIPGPNIRVCIRIKNQDVYVLLGCNIFKVLKVTETHHEID